MLIFAIIRKCKALDPSVNFVLYCPQIYSGFVDNKQRLYEAIVEEFIPCREYDTTYNIKVNNYVNVLFSKTTHL